MVLDWSSRTSGNSTGSVRVVDGVAVVRLRGELDMATGPALRELLEAARAVGTADIVVDLGGVSFIDAHTIGEIVCAWSAGAESGQQLRVEGLAKQPARMFEILGLRGLSVPRGPDAGSAGRTA